jgi:hypothetical protein
VALNFSTATSREIGSLLSNKGHTTTMCFDYEFPELEKDPMKSIKQKKTIEKETEKLEENLLTLTA